MREGLDYLDAALDQDIGPTTVVAGDPTDQDAQCEANSHTEEPHAQRDPCPIDHPGQEITTEPVGTEQEQLAAAGRTDEMQVSGDQSPEQIFVAAAEEAD